MKYKRTILALVVLTITAWHGGAYGGDAWLDANGIRIDNVNLNGLHVTNNTYWIDPPFLSAKVRPNVLFVLDNSGSMNEPAYRSDFDPTQFVNGHYFGYFDPTTWYEYASNQWTPTTKDPATATSANPIAKGDILNWAYTAKIEAAKKLLLGGKANPRSMTTGCCVKLTGETSASSYSKNYDSTLVPVADKVIYPFDGNYLYRRSGGSLTISPITAGTTLYAYPAGELSAPVSWLRGGSSVQPTLWQSVDETAADNGTTTILNQSKKDIVLFDYLYADPVPALNIANISISVVARESSSSSSRRAYLAGALQVNGETYSAGTVQITSTSYRTYTIGSWDANPDSGAAWTWADIKTAGAAALEGFGMSASINNGGVPTTTNYPTVTRVQLVITLDVPAGGTYGLTVDTNRSDVRGILDDLSNDARFGLAYYNTSNQGGRIETYVDFGTPTSMITSIGNLTPSTWTPLAETLHEMVRYFRQEAPYYNNNPGDYIVAQKNDPYYFQYTKLAGSGLTDQYVPCAKSFILMMTDGEPTQDLSIPAALQDYDNDGKDPGTYPSNGSDYLDDVAYWARQLDHRADLTGVQNIITYPVFMFGKGSNILMDTAINGGYEDLDGNNKPGCIYPKVAGAPTQDELRECYRNSNGNLNASGDDLLDPYNSVTNPDGDVPLTYFQGDDGYELQTSIIDAIAAILKRAASGTSVSVLGSSWKGEGSMYQAYFYPEKVEGLRRIKWTGYFHSLFVDRNGLIHEDTNGDGKMIPSDDYVVEFEFQAGNDTKIKYFKDEVNNVDMSDPHPDGKVDGTVPIKTVGITDAHPIWDGGKMLAKRDPADRAIYTSLDAFTATPPATNPTLIDFKDTNASSLRPYLRAKTDAAATNLINFVRGAEIPGWRDRRLTVDGTVMTWKLGDIVFSDPVVVATPKERFDVIYNDKTYAEFYNQYANRRSVVYVGVNDGVLRAFNGGFFLSTTETNPDKDTAQITFCTSLDPNDDTKCGPDDPDKPLGKELWGFIPPDVLPHLAWMADPDYQHTYYVDNMVRVTDARIFADDKDHPKGWGTVIIVSLRFGGGEIDVTDDFGSGSTTKQFKSAYYALDVTNPDLPPKLLWRFTDYNMGFTWSVPTFVREEAGGADTWYIAMGSGPSNYRGGKAIDNTIVNTKFTKDTVVAGLKGMDYIGGFLYVMNLATGAPDAAWTVHPSSGRRGVIKGSAVPLFITSPTAVDYPLDFKYDMLYLSYIYCSAGCSADGYGTWSGDVQRVKTFNSVDPGKWVWSRLFATNQPVTVKPAVGIDQRGNIWVYYGTGRFLHIDDRFNTVAQNYYGIKDPCYTANCSSTVLNGINILNSSSITVNSDGTITPVLATNALGTGKPSANISRFDDLANFMRDQADGWKITLAASERVIVNGFVVGGVAGFGSYTPTQSLCEFEGRSKQYYPYYLTGTVPYIPGGTFLNSVWVDSGGGLPSIPAVRVGYDGKVTLYLQKSTGEIQVLEMQAAQTVSGGLGSGGECD
jgi:type IV pilus assembly protein PilY1